MSEHDNDTCPHLVRASLLEAENANLKAEVERLHKYVETMERESMSDEYDINHQTRIINGLLTDKERLQAEVERLISVSEAWKKRRLDKVEDECIKWSDYEKLKAENERLRKAGDAMDEVEKCFDGKTPILEGIESVRQIVRRWIKAKEGNPSV